SVIPHQEMPSLFKNDLLVKGPANRMVNCRIFDSSGRVIYETATCSGGVIHPEIPDGYYNVLLTSEGFYPVNKKVMRMQD
ncbi:MAG: hypothetical protein ACKOA1_11065, partial [Bacteroidota bacterium]